MDDYLLDILFVAQTDEEKSDLKHLRKAARWPVYGAGGDVGLQWQCWC